MSTAPLSLDTEERHFFKTVYNAAFANPFSRLRERLDQRIAGLFPSAPRRKAIDMCVLEVNRRLSMLEAAGITDINVYGHEDRELLRVVYLFDIFHNYRDRFDAHIEDQIKAGDTPVKVDFAREARDLWTSKGFSQESFYHYFALSFQLRRAFHFISTSLVGTSPCMRTLKKHLWNNVFTYDIVIYEQMLWNRMEDFSTLLLGETGTGKGTAAKAIGRSGFIPFDPKTGCFKESFTQAFSSLNLSQFPETLLESELFGHTKGGIYRSRGKLSRGICPVQPFWGHSSGRNRGDPQPCPDQTAPGPPGASLHPGGGPPCFPLQRPGHCRHQPPQGGYHGRQGLPGRFLLPPLLGHH